jgi:hypothetical protein
MTSRIELRSPAMLSSHKGDAVLSSAAVPGSQPHYRIIRLPFATQ